MKPRYAKKKRKKSEKQKLKDKAWKLFSKYIRLRHANKDGEVICVTCGRKYPWKETQAGHFLDGRNNSILFDDRGCQIQCLGCNYYGGGTHTNVKKNYYEFMLKTYGQEVIDELVEKKGQIVKFSTSDLIEIIDDLNDKLVGLDIERGEI